MNKIELKRRDIKIVISGDIVEYFEYRIPINVEKREHEIIKGSKEEPKRDNNIRRAQSEIRRYVWHNITKYSKFVTLTYAKTCLDFDQVLYDMKMFFKNLSREGYSKLKYLWILEHQKGRGVKENNEGSLHVHLVLFLDDFLPFQVLNKCWKQGSTDIEKIDNVDNVGAYICKYLTKEEFDLFGKHSYHISRVLPKPEERCHDGYITDPDFEKELLDRVDWYYMGTRDYTIETEEKIIKNSVFYKQGRLKNESKRF